MLLDPDSDQKMELLKMQLHGIIGELNAISQGNHLDHQVILLALDELLPGFKEKRIYFHSRISTKNILIQREVMRRSGEFEAMQDLDGLHEKIKKDLLDQSRPNTEHTSQGYYDGVKDAEEWIEENPDKTGPKIIKAKKYN